MAKSERTRGRILDTARRLFNERGTAAVSTNLIAAEAGISPGNLDYRLGEWLSFGAQLVAQGMLREPSPPQTLADLGVAMRLIATSWLSFLDVTGDPEDPLQVAGVGDLIRVALHPYLTARGRRQFEGARMRGRRSA
jgi:hypothetical protein